MANPSKSNTTITSQFQTVVLQRQISTDSARIVGNAEVTVEARFWGINPRLAFSYQLAFESHRGDFLRRMERPMRIELTPEPWQVCQERSVKDLRGSVSRAFGSIWSGQKP